MSASSHVLALVGADGALDPALAGRLNAAVSPVEAPIWLAPGHACDIALDLQSADMCDQIMSTVAGIIADRPIDTALLPRAGRRKALLISDMDCTIIQQECIDELADLAGVGHHIAAITERAMRGELDFEAALRERVSLLAGLDVAVLERTFRERVVLTPGARTLVQTMRANGAFCALVSGGFNFFTERVGALAGFDFTQANTLMIADGRLTGTVRSPVLGREAKADLLEQLLKEHNLDRGASLAVGDGANDLAMIEAAGLGVAFHGKPILARNAKVRVDHGDLSTLLYFQGYAQSEFRN